MVRTYSTKQYNLTGSFLCLLQSASDLSESPKSSLAHFCAILGWLVLIAFAAVLNLVNNSVSYYNEISIKKVSKKWSFPSVSYGIPCNRSCLSVVASLPTYIYRCLIVCAMYFNLLLKLWPLSAFVVLFNCIFEEKVTKKIKPLHNVSVNQWVIRWFFLLFQLVAMGIIGCVGYCMYTNSRNNE